MIRPRLRRGTQAALRLSSRLTFRRIRANPALFTAIQVPPEFRVHGQDCPVLSEPLHLRRQGGGPGTLFVPIATQPGRLRRRYGGHCAHATFSRWASVLGA